MWTGRNTFPRPRPKEKFHRMTANQRRPGFRLPWSSEMDAEGGEVAPGGEDEPMTPTPSGDTPAAEQAAPDTSPASTPEPAAEMEAPAVASEKTEAPAEHPAEAVSEPADDGAAGAAASAAGQTGDEFMRDLVAAMRKVADEARDSGVADLRTRADDQVRLLESDAERRREELRERAEKDVTEVGEWEKAEAERIKKEAEQRVVARRAQLDQQLATDTTRTEAETKAVRERVAEYERELDAYHSQLIEINDPAAFAAAAKRMPKAPSLDGGPAARTDIPAPSPAAATAAVAAAPASADDQVPVEPVTSASNGVPEPTPEVHPAEEEVLAARLAELDATLPQTPDAPAAMAAPIGAEPATTEVVVKGLGSFGAITGFRQALSGVEGIDAVALSLGQTGEFVFRATHAAGFDVRNAIAQLEGDGAKIEDRPEGGLRVTLDRAR
jgi:hypothetical protein